MTTPTGRAPAAVTLLLWLGLLAGVLTGLHGLGGALAPPPMADPSGLDEWLEGRSPAEAAFALLRLVGLGTAWYLLGATVLSASVRVSQVRVVIRATDVFTVPFVRRLTNAVAGVTVAAATLSTGANTDSAAHAASRHEVDMITLLAQADNSPFTQAPITGPATSGEAGGDGGDPGSSTAKDAARDGPALPTLKRLPDAPDPSQPLPSPAAGPRSQSHPSAAPAPPPALPAASAPQTPPPADRWEVKPGQHFWSVAERLLASTWPRPPSDEEVDPYWRRLVAANRSVLRDPDNPDLLYPGQVIAVPTPPPAPPGAESPDLEANPAR